jgi:chorismate synthase
MNTIGTLYRVTIWGESHGPAIGGVIHGIPAGTPIDLEAVQQELERRRPGQSRLTTQRSETDTIETRSGLRDGNATGAPIAFQFPNKDTESDKYDQLREKPRPGHSDYPAHIKYQGHNDLRGGGHFSGRLTAVLVAAGAIARQTLTHHIPDFQIAAWTKQIGDTEARIDPDQVDLAAIRKTAESHPTRCPDPEAAETMAKAVEEARRARDSLGGIVTCAAEGLPVGLGEPFFDSVEGVLSHLLYSVPAVKAVSFGSGFRLARMRGSQANDPYTYQDGNVTKTSNHAGGVLGGLTDGARLTLEACVKPASSIALEQSTVDLTKKENTTLAVTGRHDPCIVVRAVPVIENVVPIGLLDLWLRARAGGQDV